MDAKQTSDASKVQPKPWTRPVEITVSGRKFHWHFVHEGDDAIYSTDDDIQMDDHLYLPENADVRLTLTSDDYMYIWSSPGLKLKEIAIPELTFQLDFNAKPAGTYELVVDPLCGFRLRHDESMGHVTILPESEFESWLFEQANE